MKRLFLVSTFILLLVSAGISQNATVTGKIIALQDEMPVSAATVLISDLNRTTTTDDDGFFEFRDVPFGKHELVFSREGYDNMRVPFEVDKALVNLEPFRIPHKNIDTEGWKDISTITLDMEDENRDQNISGLLRASEDIFVSTAGYTFGSVFFKPRGYDSENSPVMITGYEPENTENGRIVWSNWGGLNDAMRNKEVIYGLGPDNYSFGGIGGMTYINTRASQYRKQLKVSYALSNRTYNNRLMVTWNSGALKNGWAFSLSGSRRWAQEGYVEGTFYDGWSYFLAAEKKINSHHTLGITIFGAPTVRASQSATVQEAYDLRGSNYYNPNWGYQNGDKRNARVKRYHNPIFMLNHYWDISDKMQLSSVLGYTFGTDQWSSLNWYNAQDPRPDYYRYLPSWQTDSLAKQLCTLQWQNDPSIFQIDWDRLYQVNYLSNMENEQARYIIENNITKYSQVYFNTRLNTDINNNISIAAGLNFRIYKAGHYKEMEDLLGGQYWVDIDQFSERDFPGNSTMEQNDLNNPNRIIKKGDKFGYNYDSHINELDIWGQASFSYNKFDYYVGATLSGTQFWRYGYMKNGRYPDNSYGKSQVYNFLDPGVKAGATYKITGRHYVTLNGVFQMRAPYFSNSFISPKIRDKVVPNLRNEKIYGGDISYIVRYPWLYARATYYLTYFQDQAEVFSFYHDDFLTYVNYSLTGENKRHQGLELGIEGKVTKFLSLFGVAAIGDYRYTNRPLGTRSYENGSKPDTAATVYLKNFYVPSTPQTALSAGVKFNYKYWFVDVNANYYDNSWLDFNPERRTQQAIMNLGPDDPLIKTITQEQELNGGFTLDASVGKSFLIAKKVYLNLNLSMTNILNNQDIQSGGYEQNRFDYVTKDINKFPPKYYYYYGRTFYFSVSVRI